ncbi:MAG TPA: BadF/BadG/BcrA/BcrD ATPase family protein [Mycobacteriales bacterium]|nr:BadF/BadG/BcrA/BcrD ATPase family protein [Mycobacteriales bacterium]
MADDELLVVGIDAGGTKVRALVCDRYGVRRGTGLAAGANPVSRGIAGTVEQLEIALHAALCTVDRSRVAAVALGMAGAAAFAQELAGVLPGVGERAGLHCPWVQLSDLEAAFAAGSAEDDGLVVLSGTGASVAEIRDRRMIRFLDGAGWLLGDLGSGFWLGCEAARAAVADREGRGEPTALTALLAERLAVAPPAPGMLPGADPGIRELVAAVYRRTPVSLSEFAPLVSQTAAQGDAIALRLIDRAAEALLGEVALMLRDVSASWVVLAGGVLLAEGPLRDAVSRGLTERSGLCIGYGRDGAGGAVWRGLQEVQGALPESRAGRLAIHSRLTSAQD